MGGGGAWEEGERCILPCTRGLGKWKMEIKNYFLISHHCFYFVFPLFVLFFFLQLSIWLDGLRTLLNKDGEEDETRVDIERLLK